MACASSPLASTFWPRRISSVAAALTRRGEACRALRRTWPEPAFWRQCPNTSGSAGAASTTTSTAQSAAAVHAARRSLATGEHTQQQPSKAGNARPPNLVATDSGTHARSSPSYGSHEWQRPISRKPIQGRNSSSSSGLPPSSSASQATMHSISFRRASMIGSSVSKSCGGRPWSCQPAKTAVSTPISPFGAAVGCILDSRPENPLTYRTPCETTPSAPRRARLMHDQCHLADHEGAQKWT